MSARYSKKSLLILKRIGRALRDGAPMRVMAMLNEDLAHSLLDEGQVVEGMQAAQQAMVMESLGTLYEAIVRDLSPASLPPTVVGGGGLRNLANRYRSMDWEDLG